MTFEVITEAEAKQDWNFTIDIEHREVKVLAIWHGKRNPAELRRRLK